MKRPNSQSGYVGILMVLIGTSVLIFLMTKVYLTPSKTTSDLQSTGANSDTSVTELERRRTAADKAADIAAQQAEAAAETNRMIDSIQ